MSQSLYDRRSISSRKLSTKSSHSARSAMERVIKIFSTHKRRVSAITRKMIMTMCRCDRTGRSMGSGRVIVTQFPHSRCRKINRYSSSSRDLATMQVSRIKDCSRGRKEDRRHKYNSHPLRDCLHLSPKRSSIKTSIKCGSSNSEGWVGEKDASTQPIPSLPQSVIPLS